MVALILIVAGVTVAETPTKCCFLSDVEVTDMTGMFYGADSFNGTYSIKLEYKYCDFDVWSVLRFYSASAFNSDLSAWNHGYIFGLDT